MPERTLPWPDIAQETWYDKLRRNVMTARAMPLRERGANQGPLGVAVNDVVASVPLKEDIAGLADLAMRVMDPTGMYGNADAQGADVVGAMANPENLRAMMEYAADHPVQTGASVFGGPLAGAAYRELAPAQARNYLHYISGTGQPMRYIRTPLREAISRARRTGMGAEPRTTENELAAIRRLESMGKHPPIDSDYISMAHLLRDDEHSFPFVSPLQGEGHYGFGKAWVDRGGTRLFDEYRFWPGSLFQEQDPFSDALKMSAQRLKQFGRNSRLSDKLTMAIEPPLEWLGMRIGKPFIVDAQLTSGSALMEGLAPLSAAGAATLPAFAGSVAQPDAIRRNQR